LFSLAKASCYFDALIFLVESPPLYSASVVAVAGVAVAVAGVAVAVSVAVAAVAVASFASVASVAAVAVAVAVAVVAVAVAVAVSVAVAAVAVAAVAGVVMNYYTPHLAPHSPGQPHSVSSSAPMLTQRRKGSRQPKPNYAYVPPISETHGHWRPYS